MRSLSLLDQSESFIGIYIENLNSYLESLSFFEFLNFSESKFWALIRFLHVNNNGILKKRSIKAELAILEYINKGNQTVRIQKSSQINAMNECSQTYIFHFDFISKYPQTVRNIVDYCRYELYKGKKDIKLAIIFSRIDQSTINSRGQHPDIQAISPKSGYMGSLIDKKSTILLSKASISRFRERDESGDNNTSSDKEEEDEGGLFGNLKSNWREPLIMKEQNDLGNSRNQVSDMNSFSATGSEYSNASYAPNRIEVESYKDNEHLYEMLVEEHPLIAFKNRRHGRDCGFRIKITLVALLKLVFLRSSLPPKYPLLNLSIMVILLFLDIGAALMVFLLYEHEAKFQITMIPYIFIYPFTIIISPIIALTSIFICKASFYRIFMNTNALTCLTNIFLTLILEFCLAFVGKSARGQLKSTDTVEPIILLFIKLVLKILLSYFACKQLAFNDNSAFHSNKMILDGISRSLQKESTGEYEAEIFNQRTYEEDSDRD